MKKRQVKLNKKLAIYQAKNGAIELRGDFDNETIWATQKQIAEVFGIERSVVTKHIRNIFKDKEVNKNSTSAIFAQVQKEGRREVKRQVEFYNLDIILAVGYRTNSAQAVNFRKWSSKILKQYIYQGYNINPEIIGKNYEQFINAVDEVKKLLPESKAIKMANVLELIKAFSGAWLSLESYDEDKFPTKGNTKKKVEIQAGELYEAVDELKKELINLSLNKLSDKFANFHHS